MTITLIRKGTPVAYRLVIVRCDCRSWLVVQGFTVRTCGECNGRCWA